MNDDLKFKAEELIYKFFDALETCQRDTSNALAELKKIKAEHDSQMADINKKLQFLAERIYSDR